MLNLTKGGNLNLTKTEPGLKLVHACLGWDANSFDGAKMDLDVTVFALDADGKCKVNTDAAGNIIDSDMIFYYYTNHKSGAIIHSGDNTDGGGSGDDETIKLHLDKMPAHIDSIAVVVTINEAVTRRQNFGMVRNSYIRLDNGETGNKLVNFDLGEDFSNETCILAGTFYKHNGDWKFRGEAQGYAGGLVKMCEKYGISAKTDRD